MADPRANVAAKAMAKAEKTHGTAHLKQDTGGGDGTVRAKWQVVGPTPGPLLLPAQRQRRHTLRTTPARTTAEVALL